MSVQLIRASASAAGTSWGAALDAFYEEFSGNNGASILNRIRVLLGRNNTETFQKNFFDDWHRRVWVKATCRPLAGYLELFEADKAL